MVTLSPFEWALWLTTTLAEIALAVQMVCSGQSRKWRGLFALVCILAAKGTIRISAILIFQNAFVDFCAYWAGELLACAAKVWLTVEIGLALCGVSDFSRAIIKRFIPAVALLSLGISLIYGFRDHQFDEWLDWMYFIAQRVHTAVTLAGLTTFILVAIVADRVSEWSHGVRGIAAGFAIDLTSASYISWLTLHSPRPHLMAGIRGCFYLAALVVWLCSTRPYRRKRGPVPMSDDFLHSYLEVKDA